MNIPEPARKIIDRLNEHGYEAYVVGGCVRDMILKREPGDWDITTSARPEQVKALFTRTLDTGIQHGTVTIMVGKEGYEVTTFRVDGDRVTLVDAIANAGDLASNARVDRIQVIRTVNGERKVFMHDFGDESLFYSPAFYLQQNDIVYVEPKYRKKSHEDRGFQYGTLLLSLVTTICSILWATK